MNLKTLGLTVTLLAGAGAPAALAQIQTYYHAGVWDAFSGRNDKGGAVCGVGYTNPRDSRRITIRFEIGGTDTMLAVSKPEWPIPDNTRVIVVMQIGLNPPWTEPGTGHGHAIDWPMDGASVSAFYAQFRSSTSMTLTFPDGNEPPWAVPLAGSSAITGALDRCVRDLTREVQAAGTGAPPPLAAAPGPTQPFSPTAGAPVPGAPAPQPDATQPTATQPTR